MVLLSALDGVLWLLLVVLTSGLNVADFYPFEVSESGGCIVTNGNRLKRPLRLGNYLMDTFEVLSNFALSYTETCLNGHLYRTSLAWLK